MQPPPQDSHGACVPPMAAGYAAPSPFSNLPAPPPRPAVMPSHGIIHPSRQVPQADRPRPPRQGSRFSDRPSDTSQF
jgi:hypothetical protein